MSAVWISWDNHRRSRDISWQRDVPLILSDKAALRSYFGDNILYVDNTAGAIAEGVRKLYLAKPFFDRHAAELASTLARDWSGLFAELRAFVHDARPTEKASA